MRPLLVLVIAIAILGGIHVFLAADRPTVRESAVHVQEQSTARYDLEVTLAFDAGPDAFSLSTADQPSSLFVQLNGQLVLERSDQVLATETPILVRDVPGVVVGRNELFVQASAVNSTSRPALRLRILRGDEAIAEGSIWPDFGGFVQGTVTLEVSD